MLSHFVGYDRVCNAGGVDTYCVVVDKNNACAHFVQYAQAYGYVADIGHVFKNAGLIRKDNCGNDCHGSIFCAAYFNFALQSASAFYNKLFQIKFSPPSAKIRICGVFAPTNLMQSIYSAFYSITIIPYLKAK